MKYTLNIVMCQDTREPLCFKLGITLNTSKSYSLVMVCKSLMVIQSHRGTVKLEFVRSLRCKVA